MHVNIHRLAYLTPSNPLLSLICAALLLPGVQLGTLAIAARMVFYVSEEELEPFSFCNKPFFETMPAVGTQPLTTRDQIFCFRPDPLPALRIVEGLPADLGYPRPADGQPAPATKAFTAASFNLVNALAFTGTWRVYSCSCTACLYYLADSRCTALGPARRPPAWVKYSIERKPMYQSNAKKSTKDGERVILSA